MNPAMIEWLGRDATGEICYRAIYENHSACPHCSQDRVTLGETFSKEVYFPKTIYHLSNSPIFHADGSVSKLTVFRDITEIKEMES